MHTSYTVLGVILAVVSATIGLATLAFARQIHNRRLNTYERYRTGLAPNKLAAWLVLRSKPKLYQTFAMGVLWSALALIMIIPLFFIRR